MTVSAIQAAKFLSKQSKWKYTPLEIQKILYLTHMLYLGQFSEPLVEGKFEAWEYGPVHTELYHLLKEWGNRPIPDSAHIYENIDLSIFKTEAVNEALMLKKSVKSFPPGNGPKLIAITHAEESAWTKAYDKIQRSKVITNDAIKKEYQDRLRAYR